MSIAIKVENLSKLYRLGEVGTGSISHDLNRFYAKIRGKEDPFSKISLENDRTKIATKGEVVRALHDINLNINTGDVVGIIGKNGAGKSTLLKILSRITSPSTGILKVKGRMASLLEVGTGFHPEMTGRENIYMNGTIMGMRKREIDGKLEEIVEFAGVAKYLDTPVKRYSSGMTVRLGFSVAAHLDAEILVVDEVLAVGDAEFQKKAIGKMQDVSEGQGRTVLFVSHNMQSIRNLCPSSVLLDKGQVVIHSNTNEVLSKYAEISKEIKVDAGLGVNNEENRRGEGTIRFTNIDVIDDNEETRFNYNMGERIRFKCSYKAFNELRGLKIFIALRSGLTREVVTSIEHILTDKIIKKGAKGHVVLEIDNIYIRPGEYPLYFHISDKVSNELTMDVVDDLTAPLMIYAGDDPGFGNYNSMHAAGYFSMPSKVVDFNIS